LALFAYRWVVDHPGRMYALTVQDDWAVMTQDGGEVKEDSTDMGNAVSIVVGAHADGSAKRAYLCRKPREWYDEDKKNDRKAVEETERMLKQGVVPEEGDFNNNAEGFYVPRDRAGNSGISIS